MLKKFLKNYWKSFFVFCSIFYLTVLYTPRTSVFIIPHQDKWMHLIMFLTLTTVIYRDISRNKTSKNKVFYLFGLYLPIIYGGIIELIQEFFTHTRSASWFDFLADTTGVLIAFLFMHLLIYRKNRS